MKKKLISLLVFLGYMVVSYAQFYDSSFYAARIKSPQAQILRYVERNMDIYLESFYPTPGYVERFLFFKIDSTGKRIEKWLFTDNKGKIDKQGFTEKNAAEVIVYWKNMFPEKTNYRSYTFVQPILYRTAGINPYPITGIPNVYLDSTSIYFDPVIRLPQLNTSMSKPRS